MLGWRRHRFPDLFEEMSRMNRMFDRFHGFERGAHVFPPMNVYDDGESYAVRAEIPGIDPADLEIQATARALKIKGERKPVSGDSKVSYHRREREHGYFNRSLNLPQPVDPDKIVASYKDGVLEVVLPKADEVRARRIQISN
jgi:HSP20 family protein